ncbi:hypothetical protein IFM89_021564 [Coptis chinensis]|uniref:Uncharacterized protein n=1 Tax=Coptis chinensis TaxID=261450 RepID=A0A835M122_9MAGN|nr:hypothetical protein IFM89_021564 [Coptis chinensis]
MDGEVVQPNDQCLNAFRMNHLCRRSTQMWSVASEDESLYKIALDGLEKLFIGVSEEHDKLFRTPNTIDASMEAQKSQEDATTSCQIPILDPNISITVGR